MSAADPTAAIASYLLEQLGDAVGGRVFRPRLPHEQAQHMPRAAIVISPSGGYGRYGAGTLELADPRLDVTCWGATPLDAQNLARDAALTLKRLEPHRREGVALKAAALAGGPVPGVHPDTDWPFCVVAVTVTHGEAAI